jgi:hypothetical protein
LALVSFPAWSGCATQEDTATQPSNESTGATGGTDTDPTAGATAAAGKGGSGSSGGTANGTAGSSGGASPGGSSAGGTGGGAQAGTGGSASAAAGAAGEGGSPDTGCKAPLDCDDKNPCTTDNCLLGKCSYTSNTEPCATDNDPCTDDVCAVGKCVHSKNNVCECKLDTECDDKEVCTDDKCTTNKCVHTNNTAACATDNMACTIDVCAAGKCTHKDNGTCGLGTPFTVDNFNSSADWLANKTTPDARAVTVTGINANNLEGNADLWIAEADTGSIEFALATMTGLGKVRVTIRSAQAGTANMVFVGLWNGTAWSDKALGAYAAIPTGGNYATIEVPTADFGQQLDKVTKLRLRWAVTGGEKTWQIDEIAVAQ